MTDAATRLTVRGLSDQRKILVRVVLAALALCAFSFAAGVVGDLSLASQTAPAATVAIPAESVRRLPLPRSDAAEAAPARVIPAAAQVIEAREKPAAARGKGEIKRDPDLAPKAARHK